ncbi:MAG TPA: hypothetical protein VH396_12905, partial [Chitinophagaceae bacterium]
MKIYYTFSLFVILTLQMSSLAVAQNHDSLILAEFYKNMDGENWKNDSNWLIKPVNTWYGITGFGAGSSFSVSELALPGNNLKGTLDTSLGDLSLLSSLNLSSNSITGNIPPELGKLSILTYMDLSGNNLTDTIPSELGNLSDISSLDLSLNNLTGMLPSGLEKLYNLKHLSLSNNKLTGTIPVEWSGGTFNSLYTLDLSNNGFSGSIPYIVDEYINLYDVSHNHFSGGTGNLLDYFDGLSVGRTADISYNNFDFDMEDVVEKVSRIGSAHGFELIYAPQYKIPIRYNEGKLSVYAGGTLSNNTYHWYKDGALDTTIVGDSTFMPLEKGTYHVIVENTIATELKLKSE